MSQIHEFLPMPHTPLRNKAIFKYLKVLSIINHHCHITIPGYKAGYFSWDVWGVTFQFHIKQKNPCVTRWDTFFQNHLFAPRNPPTRRTCQKPCEALKAPGPGASLLPGGSRKPGPTVTVSGNLSVWRPVLSHPPSFLIKRRGNGSHF